MQGHLTRTYESQLVVPRQESFRQAHISSAINGVSQGMQFYCWALGYYAGAHFIALGLTDFPSFFRCLMVGCHVA